ncbi:MAG: hypothetical protein NVS4B13_00720 [Candidatus Elarobacter sp.]
MLSMSRVLSVVGLAAIVGGPFGTAPALAQATAQNATTAAVRISGTASDQQGTPLSGVIIMLTGPQTYTITTDAQGRYTLAVVPGVYTATARRGGFTPAQITDVAVVAGTPTALNVSLQPVTFTSLREIGRVSTTSRAGAGSVFNSSPAAVAAVGRAQIEDQNQFQVMRLLDQTPGVVTGHPNGTANGAAPGAITIPNVRGGLAFETQSLFDGHPLSVGRFGNYVTTFLDTDMFQNVEVVKGPGVMSPVINYAVNGAVNFRTLDPTSKPRSYMRIGTDSFGGSNFGLRTTGTTMNGKLGYAIAYASDGTVGPAKNYPAVAAFPSNVLITGRDQNGNPVNGYLVGNGITAGGSTTGPSDPNTANRLPNPYAPFFAQPFNSFATLIGCCQPIGTEYNVKNELVKLRWNFTPGTSLTASYFGSQAYANQAGNNFTQQQDFFVPGPGYNAGPTGIPAQSPFLLYTSGGSTNGGARTDELNNEPIFQAEFRTAVGRDNFIARAYTASISRLLFNTMNQANAPYSQNYQLYGTGTIIPVGATAPVNVAFNGQNNLISFVPGGTSIGARFGGAPNYFRQTEEDKLRGYSVEYDHFLNAQDDLAAVSYDTYRSETHYRQINSPSTNVVTGKVTENITDPIAQGAYQNNSTLQVRLSATRGKLTATLGNYFSTFFTHANLTDATVTPNAVRFFDTSTTHWDPRLAITYRATRDVSLRAAAGSSIAAPYINLFTGTNQTPAGACGSSCSSIVLSLPPANLKPETAFGVNFGFDARLGDGVTLLSADIYQTNLFNQLIGSATVDTGRTFPNPGGNAPIFSRQAANLSNARYQGLEIRVGRDVPYGLGFTSALSLIRAYPFNVPKSLYQTGPTTPFGTNLAIVPNINFLPGGFPNVNAVSNQSIPYSQAFQAIRYRNGPGLAELGATYYGPNNSFNRRAFTLFNASARFKVNDDSTTFQISADNLFNFGGGQYWVEGNSLNTPAEPLVGGKPPNLVNMNAVPQRRITFTLRRTMGR